MSGGLIALGFIGQASHLGAAFFAFGLILLPTLAFVGLTTFLRTYQSGLEDARYADRIARLRAFYFDHEPTLDRYLLNTRAEERLEQQGISAAPLQKYLTMSGTVAVITAAFIGADVGLVGAVTTDHSPMGRFRTRSRGGLTCACVDGSLPRPPDQRGRAEDGSLATCS